MIVGSDSHVFYDVGEFGEAEILLEEVGFPEAQIVNLDLSRLAHIGISV